jgi:hypothetical protein
LLIDQGLTVALQARFAKWDPVLQLKLSELDYSNDGIMVNPAAPVFGEGVYHYVRALAYASAAAHETGKALGSPDGSEAPFIMGGV